MPEIIIPGSEDSGEILAEWVLEEYSQHKREKSWYLWFGGAGIALILYGFFTGNVIFSFIIMLFAIVLYLQHVNTPPKLPFMITERGVVVGNRLYKYSELDSFFIVYNPPEVKMLYINPQSSAKPRLRIPMQDQDPLDIRSLLGTFMMENLEEDVEPFSDQVGRTWRLH